MQVVITAVGPDNRGLADPIVHYVTSAGANISEIQMYDHDAEKVFAMMLRVDWDGNASPLASVRKDLEEIGVKKGLSVRVWSRDEHPRPPRLAFCTTARPEPLLAVLRSIRDGRLQAEPAVVLGNRPACRGVAEQFGVDWHLIGDDEGQPDHERMVELIDQVEADYIVLARYMRILPVAVCWEFAGGRIINLHHGLLPAFPGAHPYRDAYGHRMLTYGATVHFIVPELDAGEQIIHQDTFTVSPGTPLDEITRIGQSDHEPACLVEGLRRVVDREVELRFHRVVSTEALGRVGGGRQPPSP
ncbi:MAG: formyltransferase family protein [Planctomycetota bacterium]|nr:formyltransferase family protein [Planctomycetota bacterium]